MTAIRPWGIAFVMILFGTQLTMAGQHGLTLTARISGGTPNKGQVIISLFTSPANYLKTPVIKKTKPVDGSGEASVRFDHLVPATYSISVIYDEDADGELDTGFLGIPSELVGFSNNAKGRFGPPSFEKTAFNLAASKTVHVVLENAKD